MSTLHRIIVYSGGMDSFTLLNRVFREMGTSPQPSTILALGFDYGQRHRKELDIAREVCERLGVRREVIVLDALAKSLATSSLTNPAIPVPEGHYSAPTMKQTVVPGRNTIMLSIAMGIAEARCKEGESAVVYYGAHGGDHHIYPDCRPNFVRAMQNVYTAATEARVGLVVPYLMGDKSTILEEGLKWGLDYSKTWTCYKGEAHPCGVCGACVERAEAFQKNGVQDPLLPH